VKHVVADPLNEYFFAAGYSDRTVHIWDIRSNKKSVKDYSPHLGEVTHLDWHPVERNVLLSGGQDCKIKAWNVEQNQQIFTISTDDQI
jgi:WD40 repeat protein